LKPTPDGNTGIRNGFLSIVEDLCIKNASFKERIVSKFAVKSHNLLSLFVEQVRIQNSLL